MLESEPNITIKDAAEKCDINYSTAKHIYNSYKNTGRVESKDMVKRINRFYDMIAIRQRNQDAQNSERSVSSGKASQNTSRENQRNKAVEEIKEPNKPNFV